jgi:hypothetical protein
MHVYLLEVKEVFLTVCMQGVRVPLCVRSLLGVMYVMQMPMGRFLLGVFLAPVALGLLFTPVFCLDMTGLSYDGMSLAQLHAAESSVAATRRWCTVLINVFLYAYVTN